MPGARCTRSLVCEKQKHTSKVTTGSPVDPAFPARWFYGFLRALPGERAFLPPSSANMMFANLMPASRHQDHTTSASATRALVSCAVRVHRIPRPTFVTVAIRPSCGHGMGRASKGDLPDALSEIFLREGLDIEGKSLNGNVNGPRETLYHHGRLARPTVRPIAAAKNSPVRQSCPARQAWRTEMAGTGLRV